MAIETTMVIILIMAVLTNKIVMIIITVLAIQTVMAFSQVFWTLTGDRI